MGLSKKRKQINFAAPSKVANVEKLIRKIKTEKRKITGMSMRITAQSLALTSQNAVGLAFICPTLVKRRKREEGQKIIKKKRVHAKVQEMMKGGYYQRLGSIFSRVWRDDAGGYLRGVRGCGSSATREGEIRRKKELEKSASRTRSIVEMFSAQQNKRPPSSNPLSSSDLP